MVRPKIQRGRTFAFPIYNTDESGNAADWIAGTLTSELRTEAGGSLLAAMTVDATDRAAADGGQIVLRLTDEETAAIGPAFIGFCDVKSTDGTDIHTAVQPFVVSIEDVVTE